MVLEAEDGGVGLSDVPPEREATPLLKRTTCRREEEVTVPFAMPLLWGLEEVPPPLLALLLLEFETDDAGYFSPWSKFGF